MNLGVRSPTDLLYVTFNQEYSCIAVGTRGGFRIYNCDPFGRCFAKYDGGIGIVEMLFTTSLVALVGGGDQPAFSPRKLVLINTKRQSTICELSFLTPPLRLLLNRRRLLVCLEEHMYLYDITNLRLLSTVDTNPNPTGLVALSPSAENGYLAYPGGVGGVGGPGPGKAKEGDVLVYDTSTLQTTALIPAHKTAVAALAFSMDGTMLATASDRGTVIRVWAVPGGELLWELRRGSIPARVHCLAFDSQGEFLAVSSESGTIHVFKLSDAPPKTTLLNSLVGSASRILPPNFTRPLEPKRDFARCKIPPKLRSMVGITGTGTKRNVMAVTEDGGYWQFVIDCEAGGEGVLERRYSLVELDDETRENE